MATAYPVVPRVDTNANAERAILQLDEHGWISDCNTAAEDLFGFDRKQMQSKHVSFLIPQLANLCLLQDGHINPRMKLLCRIGWQFTARARGRLPFHCHLFLSQPGHNESRHLRLIARESDPALRRRVSGKRTLNS